MHMGRPLPEHRRPARHCHPIWPLVPCQRHRQLPTPACEAPCRRPTRYPSPGYRSARPAVRPQRMGCPATPPLTPAVHSAAAPPSVSGPLWRSTKLGIFYTYGLAGARAGQVARALLRPPPGGPARQPDWHPAEATTLLAAPPARLPWALAQLADLSALRSSGGYALLTGESTGSAALAL